MIFQKQGEIFFQCLKLPEHKIHGLDLAPSNLAEMIRQATGKKYAQFLLLKGLVLLTVILECQQ